MFDDVARWTERELGEGEGKAIMTAGSMYGISGASHNAEKYRRRGEILACAFLRLGLVGDRSYFLGIYGNINPENSGVLRTTVAGGIIVDIPEQYGYAMQHTLYHKGPEEGV